MKQTGRPRGKGTLPPDDVPLNWLWYRRERVRDTILHSFHDPEEPGRILTRSKNDAARKRWWVIQHGRDHAADTGMYEVQWVSLPIVDRIFCLLDLHIWILGEPDVVSPHAPRDDLLACPRGHAYTIDNTRWERAWKKRKHLTWVRRCRECDAERYLEQKQANAAA